MRRAWFVFLAVVLSTSSASAQQGAASSNLAAVFNAGANIGFSVIRAAYSPPDQPPPQAALEWMVRDMENAKNWAAAVQPCIPFDPKRFDDAAGLARSGATAARLTPVFEQLARDLGIAVRGSTCGFGLASPQAVEAYYQGAVLTGYATARASYFYYPTPIPPQVAQQIRGDFAGIRAALPAAAACAGSPSPMTTRLDRLESQLPSTAGQAVYTELVAIYQSIEASVGNPACAGRPVAVPASCTTETLLRTTCASVCQGAQVLLGVVSGGPECQACLARGCR